MAAHPPTASGSASPLDRYASPVAATRRRPGRAVAAMVLGILGLLLAIVPLAAWTLGTIALITGVAARRDIERAQLAGRGMATAGIVLGAAAMASGTVVAVIVAMLHHS